MNINSGNTQWLLDFQKNKRRKPRILHIGNIANNAYRNAKFLNETGLVECDVICYDYYHLMAYPEWEDADIKGTVENQFSPDFRKVKLSNFKRPDWFVQGPLKLCIKYLILKNEKDIKYKKYWEYLKSYNKSDSSFQSGFFNMLNIINEKIFQNGIVNKIIEIVSSQRFIYLLYSSIFIGKYSRYIKYDILRELVMIILLIGLFPLRLIYKTFKRYDEIDIYEVDKQYFINLFQNNFSQRKDKLTEEDFIHYDNNTLSQWKKLFSYYDVIQGYAIDPILPLLCQSKIYIGYEHGTLRDFTLTNNSISRLTSLAYHNANHVFITNGDCLSFAQKIGVNNYSAMIHPIDEKLIESIESKYDELHEEYKVQYLFLCTLRHDWKVKGTDIYIRALPELKLKLGESFKVLMTKWGQELESSLELAKSIGCDDVIEWIEPLSRKKLIQYKKSVDIVFDQIALPHFGATAPEAIACGTPVIMSYEPISTQWIIPERAPILSAKNTQEVVVSIVQGLDKDWLKNYKIEAGNWFYKFHSSSIVVDKHMDVYKKLLK